MHPEKFYRFAVWGVLLLQPSLAFAYIDPLTGGLVFQLLAPVFAALLGAWVFLRRTISEYSRSLWRKVTGKPDL